MPMRIDDKKVAVEELQEVANKAVSERLFSIAILCIYFSEIQLSKGTTAAGLPEKILSVNASIWYNVCFLPTNPIIFSII